MDAWVWILIVLAAIAVIAVVGLALRQRRSRQLRERFGPEYERTLRDRQGDQRAAEADLRQRRELREQLEIRPLSAGARDRYADDWRAVQARFVDEPVGAVRDADRLVTEVMRERGYPMDDFENQADLISVDHPQVVEDYRAGHAISVAYDRGDSSTEDLRQAMVHYRALFDDLLESGHQRHTERAGEAR
jgi:hypothetical protein